MLDPQRLRLLCDLSRLGTITAVARARNYTSSAVSQQLAVLEKEAGVELLERTGRRVALTAAGRVLVQHGESVLTALEGAGAAMAATRDGLSGPLRIGAFPTILRTVLPGALIALSHDHPRLELDVYELDPAAVPAALRERRIDVGLVNDYDIVAIASDDLLDTVPLLEEVIYLAVHDQESITAPDPVSGARDAPWILGSPGTMCHDVVRELCRGAGFVPRVRHHVDDFATAMLLVAARQGVAIVPELACAQPPSLVRLEPTGIRRRTWIAHRRGASAHPAVVACVTALRGAAIREPPQATAAGSPVRSTTRSAPRPAGCPQAGSSLRAE